MLQELLTASKTIPPTSGMEKIGFAFDIFVDIDTLFLFLGGGDDCAPTKEMGIQAYAEKNAHTFADAFGGIPANLDAMYVTLSQVVEFTRANRDWIATGERAIYFLYKFNKLPYVVSVSADYRSKLRALVFRYDDVTVWSKNVNQIFIIPKR